MRRAHLSLLEQGDEQREQCRVGLHRVDEGERDPLWKDANTPPTKPALRPRHRRDGEVRHGRRGVVASLTFTAAVKSRWS